MNTSLNMTEYVSKCCSKVSEQKTEENKWGQKESNRFMPVPELFWHPPACKVSFLVTLKHHLSQGLSLT